MQCLNCNIRIELTTANFCPECGASLKGTKGKIVGFIKRAKHKAGIITQNAKTGIGTRLDNYITNLQTNGLSVGGRKLSEDQSRKVISHLSKLRSRIDRSDFDSDEEYSQWISALDERLGGDDKCIICFQKWSDTKSISVCKYCYQGGHSEHMISWLSTRNSCPLCLEHLERKDLLLVKIEQ